MKQQIVYSGWERKDVLVELDGAWFPGELRMWTQHDDDSRIGLVEYKGADELRYLDSFPSDRIKPDDTDYTPASFRP